MVTLAETSANLSRRVRNMVREPDRRLISISWPSTQTQPSRSTQPLTACATTRSGCGFSGDDSMGMTETIVAQPDSGLLRGSGGPAHRAGRGLRGGRAEAWATSQRLIHWRHATARPVHRPAALRLDR